MKRLLFCLMALTLTFVVASARDVGYRLQPDIGITYTVPTVQPIDFTAYSFAAATVEMAQAVPVQLTPISLTVNNENLIVKFKPPVYKNPDYGSWKYLYLRTTNIENYTVLKYPYYITQRYLPTARHVI